MKKTRANKPIYIKKYSCVNRNQLHYYFKIKYIYDNIELEQEYHFSKKKIQKEIECKNYPVIIDIDEVEELATIRNNRATLIELKYMLYKSLILLYNEINSLEKGGIL